MKKALCLILSFILLLGIFSGCAEEEKMHTAVKKLAAYSPQQRADMISLALPMLLTNSGLDLATDLIIAYNPQSNSMYNTLLHPVFKVIDQKTALAAVAQVYKIDEPLRSKYFEGFQRREKANLSANAEAILTKFFEREIAQIEGLEKICKEDNIDVAVLAQFCKLFVELNGHNALFTDADASDFACGVIRPLLDEIMLGMTEGETSATQSVQLLAHTINTKYSAIEKQQLKLALREVGLYTPSALCVSGGLVGGGVLNINGLAQIEPTLNGFGYKIVVKDADEGDIIEVAFYENDVKVEGVELTEPLKIAIPVNSPNVMLYYEDGGSVPVKYTAYVDGMLYCHVDKTGIYKLYSVEPYFVDANGWGKDYIEALFRRGIISGKSAGVFAPEAQITREEFVKLAVELFSLTDTSLTCDFADVAADAWYAPYIASAKYHGIVNGISDTQFGVGMPITRQDMCKILYGMLVKMNLANDAEQAELTFHDAQQIAPYAQESVEMLVHLGIINGDDKGKFNPTANATRQEAAKLIYGMLALYVQ